MKILVTGGLGFIGSYFVKYTLANRPDIKIMVLDNNASPKQQMRLSSAHLENPNCQLVVADINGDLSEILEGIDIIFHFAAKTFVDHSVKYPHLHFWNNTNGTFNLLFNARSYKPFLVQISTDEVYGESEDNIASSETFDLRPTNPYAASKAAADMMVMGMSKTYNISYLITRCENNYGPFQHLQKVIPVYIKYALEDRPLPVYHPGTQSRCWLHVEDHCSAIWYLIDKGKRGVVNIGAGKELPNIELAKMVLRILNKPVDNIMMIDTRDIRPYHDKAYRMDCSLLSGLGWMPRYDNFELGLRETVQWYVDNKRWLE